MVVPSRTEANLVECAVQKALILRTHMRNAPHHNMSGKSIRR